MDKHSTGGVGDKTSLLLVPIVSHLAEKLLGKFKVRIPMVSGRALGHSGGTLDKLESVPGFSPLISIGTAKKLLQENGYFMMGQTEDLAPLDRLLYALRDVTATVESRPLIVSSIMSKKLAENLDGLVIDVKVGAGAFMKNENDARALASALVEVAKREGKDAVALLTSMDEPLGNCIGNSLEVEECWRYLEGEREEGLHTVTRELAAWMIHLASRRRLELTTVRDAYDECLQRDRSQLQKNFKKMFQAQGGDIDQFLKERDSKKSEMKSFTWRAAEAGVLTRMDAYSLGVLLNSLGGGRLKKEDCIHPEVGIRLEARVGDKVEKGQRLATLFYFRAEDLVLIQDSQARIVTVGTEPSRKLPWIKEVV